MKKVRNGFIRNLHYFCLIGVITLGLMTIVGTGGGGGGGTTTTTTLPATEEIIISENSVVLDDETAQSLASVSSDNSTLIFDSSTSTLQTLQVGGVVTVGVTENTPYGFLGEITSITQQGDQVVVETTQAKLTDVIEQGTISVSKTLTTNDTNTSSASIRTVKGVSLRVQPAVRNARTAAAAVEIDPDTELFNLELNSVVLYDHDGNENTTNDQIVADGGISFGLGFDLEIRINWFKVQSLTFTTTPWQIAEISLSSTISKSIEKKVQIAQCYMSPITVMVGTWPVVMVPVVTVYVGIDGEISVGVTTGVTESASLTAGVEYKDGEWGPISNFEIDFDYEPSELSASTSIKGYVEPDFALLLYGIVGPYATLQGYLRLDADITDEPWWSLYGGIVVGAGVEIEVIGHEIVDFEIPDIISYEALLDQAPDIDGMEDQPPDIRSGDVDPSSGYLATIFTFSVDYGDGDNDPPTTKKLVVDGTEYDMSTTDTDYTDYSTFTKGLTGNQLGLGSHNFYFEFGNAGGSERLPTTGEFSGPTVNSTEPSMYVYEPDGVDDYVAKLIDSYYEIKWEAADPDGDGLTIDLYYNTSRSTDGMTQIVSDTENTGSYSWDVSDVPNGSYYIYGVSDDGHEQTDDDWSTGQVAIGNYPHEDPQESWEDVENISTSGSLASIAVGSSGKVHVVWTNGEVYYRQSNDEGYSWESTIQVSTAFTDATDAEIAVDTGGNVHIVWAGGSPTQVYYEKLDNNGNTLIDQMDVSQSSSWTEDPDIAVDSNGYVHVVWQDSRNSPEDIRYNRSTDGGSTWSGSEEIGSGGSKDLYYPSIATDSNNVYVIFTDPSNVASGGATYLVKSSNSGATWGSMTVVSDGDDKPKYPDLYCFDSALHLVYRFTTGIYYRESVNEGGSWTGTTLSCFPIDGSFPSIAVDATGIYVTRSGGYFAESLDGGNQWSSEIDLGVGNGKWTKIALDSSGHIHVLSDGVTYRRTAE